MPRTTSIQQHHRRDGPDESTPTTLERRRRHAPTKLIRALLPRGLTLEEMAALAGGVSRQYIDQILKQNQWKPQWKLARQERKKQEHDALLSARSDLRAKESLISTLLGQVRGLILANTRGEPDALPTLNSALPPECSTPAYLGALHYCHKRTRLRPTSLAFDDVHLLLRCYFDAKARGEALSLRGIARQAGLTINPSYLEVILRGIGEQPLQRIYPGMRRLTPAEKDIAIRAVASTAALSNTDKSYFLQREGYHAPPHVIAEISKRHPELRPRSYGARGMPRNIHHFTREDGTIPATQCLQFYEAIQSGFTREEARRYAGIANHAVLERIIAHQPEVEMEYRRLVTDIGVQRFPRLSNNPYYSRFFQRADEKRR